MTLRLAVIAACLVLAGCPATVAPPPSKSATPLTCDGSGPCEVNILNPTCGASGCTAEVDRDPVTFRRGRHDIVVRWKLPPGFGFCANTGDGVFLKKPDPNDQFKDARSEGGEGSGVCRRPLFLWTAKNTVSNLRFPYKIIFHDTAGNTEYIVDPAMFNE